MLIVTSTGKSSRSLVFWATLSNVILARLSQSASSQLASTAMLLLLASLKDVLAVTVTVGVAPVSAVPPSVRST